MASVEHRELLGFINQTIRDEVARALKSRDASMADAIGKMFAEERAKHREFVTRMMTTTEKSAAPDNDAAVLDLRAERARRNGSAA